MRLIWFCLLILSVAQVTCCQRARYSPDREEIAAARVLGLIPPVEVDSVDMYLDGGTLEFVLSGVEQKTLEVCLDNRTFQPQPRSIYVGARYPSSETARRLEIGGPEDRAVILLVRKWLKRNFSPKELRDAHDIGTWRSFRSAQQRKTVWILIWLDAQRGQTDTLSR